MPFYKLLYKPAAVRDIKKMTEPIRKRVKDKLEWWVSQNDPLHFSSRLSKPANAEYRLRIGVYRVLFDVEGNNIVILRVRHRRESYRK